MCGRRNIVKIIVPIWQIIIEKASQTENCSKRLNEALKLSDIGLDLH